MSGTHSSGHYVCRVASSSESELSRQVSLGRPHVSLSLQQCFDLRQATATLSIRTIGLDRPERIRL